MEKYFRTTKHFMCFSFLVMAALIPAWLATGCVVEGDGGGGGDNHLYRKF
jgi:hypothetical protein